MKVDPIEVKEKLDPNRMWFPLLNGHKLLLHQGTGLTQSCQTL